MITGDVLMDSQKVMELVANASAQQAAQAVAIEARAEIAEQFSHLENSLLKSLDSRFSAYFGETKPADHIIQHDRLKRGIEWYDGLISSLANKLVMSLIVAAAVLGGGLWVAGKVFGAL